MIKNLFELAKECPGLQVTITLGELIEARIMGNQNLAALCATFC